MESEPAVDGRGNILGGWINKNDLMDFYKFLRFRPGFLAQIKSKDESYFRALFEKYILKNKNRITVHLKADKSKSKKREEKIKKSLDNALSQFSDEEILKLNKNLEKWQKPDFDEEEKIKNLFKFDFDSLPKGIEKVEGEIKKSRQKTEFSRFCRSPQKQKIFAAGESAFQSKNFCLGKSPVLSFCAFF